MPNFRTKPDFETQLNACAAASPRAAKSAEWSAHLSRWPIYAAATGAVLAMATSADASIISGVAAKSLTISSPPGYTHNLVDTNVYFGYGRGRLVLGLFTESRGRLGFAEAWGTGGPLVAESRGFLRDFNRGSAITSNLTFRPGFELHQQSNPSSAGRGPWPQSVAGYAGFRMPVSGGFGVGWIKLEWTGPSTGYPTGLQATNWAFDTTPGQGILAGDTGVPEPGTLPLSLLALGAAGILAWRKSRPGHPYF